MNELECNSRGIAREMMKKMIGKIDREMNLKWDYFKFDALYYALELIKEQERIINDVYKNDDWSELKRYMVVN